MMLRLTTASCRRSHNDINSNIGLLVRSLSSSLPYKEEKLAAKEKRRQQWQNRQEKPAREKARRQGRENRGIMKKEFREWHDKRRVYHEILDKVARRSGLEWKIQIAAVLERLPAQLPEPPQWEKDYQELDEYLEQFRGWDFPPELNIPEEEGMKAKEDEEEEDDDEKEEVEEVDDSFRNLHRRPEKRVFLALQDDNNSWQFPTTEIQEGQTLVKGAHELITNMFEPDASIVSMGNAPIGVYLDKYDDPVDGYFGAKTFYMKLQYQEGLFKENDNNKYGWPDRSEITESNHANSEKLYRYML